MPLSTDQGKYTRVLPSINSPGDQPGAIDPYSPGGTVGTQPWDLAATSELLSICGHENKTGCLFSISRVLMNINYIAHKPSVNHQSMHVRPKKHLGQHFLVDQDIADRIVSSITGHGNYKDLVELGPGTGVLTRRLCALPYRSLYLFEVDRESISYLEKHFKEKHIRIVAGDFLKKELSLIVPGQFGIIGNFPYNISSQIFFHVLKFVNQVPEIVCMLQKEVAQRICAEPGNKIYGILSILLGAYYHRTALFDVPPDAFHPRPKVDSSVIRLTRNDRVALPCDEITIQKNCKTRFSKPAEDLAQCIKTNKFARGYERRSGTGLQGRAAFRGRFHCPHFKSGNLVENIMPFELSQEFFSNFREAVDRKDEEVIKASLEGCNARRYFRSA